MQIIHLEREKKHYISSSEGHPDTNIIFFKSSNLVDVDPTSTGTSTSMSEVEPCAKKKKVMTITNTMKAISMVTSPMCAPVASRQNIENIPKTPEFGAVHLQLVGNP